MTKKFLKYRHRLLVPGLFVCLVSLGITLNPAVSSAANIQDAISESALKNSFDKQEDFIQVAKKKKKGVFGKVKKGVSNAAKKANEAKKRAEEEARKRADEARRRAEDAKRRAEAEARKRAEEAKRRAEEAKRRAEAEARKRAEEAKRRAQAEAKKRADQARQKAAEAKKSAAKTAKKTGKAITKTAKNVGKGVTNAAIATAAFGAATGKWLADTIANAGCLGMAEMLKSPDKAKAMFKKTRPVLKKMLDNVKSKMASAPNAQWRQYAAANGAMMSDAGYIEVAKIPTSKIYKTAMAEMGKQGKNLANNVKELNKIGKNLAKNSAAIIKKMLDPRFLCTSTAKQKNQLFQKYGLKPNLKNLKWASLDQPSNSRHADAVPSLDGKEFAAAPSLIASDAIYDGGINSDANSIAQPKFEGSEDSFDVANKHKKKKKKKVRKKNRKKKKAKNRQKNRKKARKPNRKKNRKANKRNRKAKATKKGSKERKAANKRQRKKGKTRGQIKAANTKAKTGRKGAGSRHKGKFWHGLEVSVGLDAGLGTYGLGFLFITDYVDQHHGYFFLSEGIIIPPGSELGAGVNVRTHFFPPQPLSGFAGQAYGVGIAVGGEKLVKAEVGLDVGLSSDFKFASIGTGPSVGLDAADSTISGSVEVGTSFSFKMY